MRYLTKLHHFQGFKSNFLHLSTLPKSSKLLKSEKIPKTQMKNDKETTNSFASLLSEITEILGADDLAQDRIASGLSISKQTQQTHLIKAVLNEEHSSCTQGVCINSAKSSFEKEGTQMENFDVKDVSPIVHEITEIVRGYNDVNSMEERLEKSGLQFDAEIVEMVLKRCFKVPHLAFRFFNWVRFKDGFIHTTGVYNTMLSIAGEAKEYWFVDKLLEKMETNACKKNIKTWTILISIYGKARSVGKALMVFEEMKKSGTEPDSMSYKMMIRLLCTAEKANIAMEFYKEMVAKEWGLDMNSYKFLMNSLARSGDTSSVQLVADDMVRVSEISQQNAYASMLKSFCISGNMKEALELIRSYKKRNLNLDYESFETLVKGLCKADRIDDAMEIINVMKRKHLADAKVYEMIVNGYLRKNNISKAFELFQNMKESGLSPTTFTYTELMQHFFKSKEYQKGIDLYHEMLENKVEIDTVAMTAIVAGHVCQSHVNEAWEAYKDMEAKGIKPTHKFYFIFIKELCKISRFDDVFKVIDKMRDSKMVIGDDLFHFVTSYLVKNGGTGTSDLVQKIHSVHRACKLDPYGGGSINSDSTETHQPNLKLNPDKLEQQKVAQDLVEPPLSNHHYNEQDLQEVCKILSSSTNWCITEEALNKCTVEFTQDLVIQILRHSALNGALYFFSWLGKRHGYKHSTETYNVAIKIAGSGKDFKHMRDLFYEMQRNGSLATPNTWTIMIMQYGRAGLTEIALKTFAEMKSNGHKPTGSTYKYLILFLCGKKGKRVDEAISLFQEMLRLNHIPDKELVEAYLKRLCEDGKLLEAKKLVKLLCNVGFTAPLSYSMYCRALIRAGRLDEVSPLLDEVGEEKPKLGQYIYASYVHGLLQKGQFDQAVAKMEEMKELGIYPTVHIYTSFIVHHFKEKQTELALKTFNKMQDDGFEPTIVTYSALIRGFMDVGKIDEAMKVFDRIKLKGPMPDFKTYSMIIASLCKVGKSEEGLKLLSEMLDAGIVPSTVNFRSVIYGLNREGKHDLARTVLDHKVDLKNKRKLLI